MAGKPYLRRGRTWAAVVGFSAGLALALGAGPALGATHYPPGSVCYDCHSVSKSKMVLGTHLLKKSGKTAELVDNGWVPGTPAPCLFCHEKAAVSVVGRTTMRGVWDHFDGTSTSKHRAKISSNLTPDDTKLDCRDCHTGIDVGVVPDGTGNAKVHNIDASGTIRLNLYGTMIGAPANAAQLSTNTCQNVACHSAAGATNFGYTAPKRHSFTRTFPGTTQRVVTINDTGSPTACTDCHGKHNSYKNTSLITLRTDGTQSNSPSDQPADLVTPDKCGECHSQDDAGVYAAKGHGQNTISGGTVGCTACHTAGVPHSFGAASTNPLRFAFAENTTKQSAIRQQPPYNQVFSVCLTCHSQYSGKEHGAAAFAGCNDCHEPHGLGVSTNVKMIRRQIPKVNASGVPVYGASSPTGTWETNLYTVPRDTTFKTDGTGLCDNRECHEGRTVAGDLIYPLSTFLTGDRHSGGDVSTAADYDCESCHTHTDDGGSWGAKASCTTCHGQPPPPADSGYTTYAETNTPHVKHAGTPAQGGYGYPCQACHFDYTSSATHNTATKTYQSLNFDVARNSSASRAYAAGTATCTNLYCHSNGLTPASVGSVQWMSGFDTPNWSAQNLACNACHGGVEGASRIGTVSHTKHLASGATCDHCHNETVTAVGTDTTTVIAGVGAHVDGLKSLKSGGTYFGQAVSFVTGGAQTCTSISCHNNGNANWGVTLTCADCHTRTTAQGGDLDSFAFGDGVVSAVSSDEWISTGHGRTSGTYPWVTPNTAANLGCLSSNATTPVGGCHTGTVTHNTTASPGANFYRLAYNDGQDVNFNTFCAVCHAGATAPLTHSEVTTAGDKWGVPLGAPRSFTCIDCHDPHGDSPDFMVHSQVWAAGSSALGIPNTTGLGLQPSSGSIVFNVIEPTPVGGNYVLDGSAAVDRMCQVCHQNNDYWRRSTGVANSMTTHPGNDSRCTSCHKHDEGFKGSGCNGCHGSTVSGQFWPNGSGGAPAYADDSPGGAASHDGHVLAIGQYLGYGDFSSNQTGSPWASMYTEAQQKVICSFCHPNPGGPAHDQNTAGSPTSRADVLNDGFVSGSFQVFKVGAQAYGNDTGKLTGSYAQASKTCANVDCHYEVATPAYAGAGWDGGHTGSIGCDSCHGNGVAGAALPNSHPAHVNAPAGTPAGMAYGCWYCHPSGVNNAAYSASHQDGAVNWSFATTLDPAAGGPRTETYNALPTGTTAVKFGTGTFFTCQNLYCHGNFPNGAVANAPTWGTASEGDCGTCHGSYGSPFAATGTDRVRIPVTSSNHPVHFQQYDVSGVAAVAVGPQLNPHPGNAQGGCNACHNILENCTTSCHVTGAGANQPTGSHADGTVDFRNGVLTYPAPNPAFDPYVPSTLAASPACDNCHSTAVAVGQTLSGVALAKTPANWSNASYKLACVTCHNAANPAWSKAGGAGTPSSNVRAPGKDAYYAADNGGHGRSGTFSATGNPAPNYGCAVCHDEAKTHVSHVLDDQDRLVGALTAQTACADCHAPGQTAPGPVLARDATVEASAHASSVTGRYAGNTAYNYSCVVCHEPHGTSNIAMIKTTIVDGMGASATNVTLLAETGLDPTSAADDGVCDRCHADAAQAHAGTTLPNNHNWGAACLSCHDHKESFRGSCTGCHGGGLASEGNGNWWPDSVPAGSGGHGTAYPNRLADHQQHIDAIAVARFGASPTTAQKNATCATCHPIPGGPNHEQNTAGSLASTADVHGDPQNTGTSFLTISGAANGLTTDTYNNAATAGGKSCANVDCHYRVTTPTTGTPTANGDGWYQPLAVATCSNCHGSGTAGAVLPNVHQAHVGSPTTGTIRGKGYTCTQCHPNHGVNMGHQNGAVDLNFAATLGEPGAIQGTQSGSDLEVKFAGPADAGAAPPAGAYATCSNLYCHGADLGNGGTNHAPVWNDYATGNCGTCHGINANPTALGRAAGKAATSGNHLVHFTSLRGPALADDHMSTGCYQCHNSVVAGNHAAGCVDCHFPNGTYGATNPGASNATASHVDGKVDFGNTVQTTASQSVLGASAPAGAPDGTSTDRCNNCHSTAAVSTVSLPGGAVGTVLAKANWSNGAYQLDCLTCHNAIFAAWSKADGAGAGDPKVRAPAVYGDGANYGAEVRGHSRPAALGAYPVSNNTPANRPCGDCHNLASAHVNHANDATYAGNRMRTTINGAAVSTVTQACQACHSTTGASPATKKDINTHSNQGYAARLEAAFTTACDQCHEPHGLVANGAAYNIFMMNPTVRVTGATTVSGVRFEARTGNYSYNDTQGTNADDLCAVCHTHASNPGYPMTYNADGNHASPAYGIDERGNNCASCHIHNQDSNLATADGLMPLQCNGCHTYPGLPNLAGTHRMSSPHDVHVGRPSSEAAVPNKGFECAKCHNGSAHNSGTGGAITSAGQWATLVAPNIDNRVQLRFDSWNPVAEAGNPVNTSLDSTSFNDTTNVCSNLYCHGATFATVSGSRTAPAWTAGEGACGMCHDTDTNDTTPTYLSTGNHRAHLADAWGPQFGTASEAACASCHPAYATGAATHVSLIVEFANVDTTPNPVSAMGNTAPIADPTTASTDRCTHCHSTWDPDGAGAQLSGTAAAKQNWSNGTYKLDCLSCHNATDPGTQFADGSGMPAPNVAGDASTYGAAVRGHNRPLASGNYTDADSAATNPPANKTCGACHDVGAAHFDGANGTTYAAQRLLATINTVATGSTVTGACNACHGSAAGTPATSQVSTHGNTNAAFKATSTHDSQAEDFAYRCEACHDVHGMTKNDRTTTSVNIFMIKKVIGVGTAYTTTPGGATTTTATPIYYERMSGTPDSLDDGTTAQVSRVCVTCHVNASRPGSTTALTNTDGNHSENNDYTNNEQGNRCTSCHQHNYDSTASTVDGFMPLQCDGCHGYPPVSNAHTVHVAAPVAGYGFACSKCHSGNNHNELGVGSAAQYTGLNAVTLANAIDIGFDSTNPGGSYTPAKGSRVAGGAGTCNALYCHGATLVGAGGSDTTPQWNLAATGDCGTCHDTGNNDTTPATSISTASHTAHLQATTQTTFGITVGCSDCHGANAATGAHANHVNGVDNVEVRVGGVFTPRATPAALNGCGTNDCHEDGLGGAPYNNALAGYTWGTALANTCEQCHRGNSMATNKHAQHLDSNSLPGTNVNECYGCHTTTATSAGLASGAQHLNGTTQVAFDVLYDYEGTAVLAGRTGTGAATTCSDIRCHNGVTTPTWAAASTITCGQCHNNTGTDPRPAGASTMRGHTSLSHANGDATYTDCDACHGNATYNVSGSRGASAFTATGGGGASPNGIHQNLVVNVYMNSGAGTYTDAANTAGGVNWNSAGATHIDDGTCGTSGCHGAGTPIWGGTLASGCFDCHTGTEVGATKPAVDATPNPLSLAQYNSQGHGQAGAFPGSGVTGPGYTYASNPGCYNCHDVNAAHAPAASGTDPFRLGATYAQNTDGLCLKAGCHDTPAIQTHKESVVAMGADWPPATGDYDYKCVDCHDPHGDANYYMVRSHLSAPQTTADTVFGSDSYGTPLDTANAQAVTFTNLTGMAVNSYGITGAAADGICEVCHTQTTYWRKDIVAEGHYPTTRCTSCHDHSGGFKASCSGCHGDGVVKYWPQSVGTNNRTGGSNAAFNDDGRHSRHVELIAARLYNETLVQLITTTGNGTADTKQKAICTYCHLLSDADHTTLTGLAEVFPVGGRKHLNGAADGGTAAAFNTTTYNCTTTDCHNSKDTGTTYNWYTGAASTCTMCHTPGGATNDPTSGLHRNSPAPTVSGAAGAHDDSFATGGTCTTCHTAVPAIAVGSAHINGVFTANDTTATNEYYTFPAYTDGPVNSGSCVGTAAPPNGVNTGCHSGVGDAGTWARKWTNAAYNSDGTECAGCHGGMNETDWTFGTVANTADGSVEHNRDWNATAPAGEVIGNHQNIASNATKCNICHVYADSPYTVGAFATYHRNGQITMNSTMGYTRTGPPAYGCTSTCHTATNSGLENSGWALQTIAGPALSCTSCHTGSGSGALAVGPASTHVTRGRGASYNTFIGCQNCHPFHTGGVAVPNNATVGINYTAGGRTGFRLGGDATTGTTEAEICWNCHNNATYGNTGANAISEWGTNTKLVTGSSPYNYGTLSTPNWTTATWTSGTANFSYKTGAIKSTHSANSAGTSVVSGTAYSVGGMTEDLDAVSNIRCSYCHDVHNTGPAPDGTPYLRGTYRSNPYPEDGAPWNKAYTSRNKYGAVPRGGPAYTESGGYFIDQNSGNPSSNTAWDTKEETAGLCMLCHGTNIDTMDSRTGEGLWVGTNGHSAAALGGTGSAKANIFDYTHGRPTPVSYGSRASGTKTTQVPNQGYMMQASTGEGYGYRGTENTTYTGSYIPYTSPASRGYGFQDYNTANIGWGAALGALQGATVDAGTTNYPYHRFTCSKCHNPHASRLPKLMITNCLDIRHNTWDDAKSSLQSQYTAATLTDRGKYAAYYDSAQNCHRRDDGQNAKNPGWNKVTPW